MYSSRRGLVESNAGSSTPRHNTSLRGASTEMLSNQRFNLKSWGYENPDTGMLRVQCDDSVAMGR